MELFFKWIKEHLRIKDSSAHRKTLSKPKSGRRLCVYVLIAIVKKRLTIKASLYEILQILSLTLFEKVCRFYSSFPTPARQSSTPNL